MASNKLPKINKLPLLIYHKLSSGRSKNKYILSIQDFVNHIQIINDYGIKTLDSNSFLTILNDIKSNKKNSNYCMITFDDGNLSDAMIALPLLKKFNMTATFFVTTDWINKDNYMSSDHIRMLYANGMSVQSHAKSHKFLDKMTAHDLYEELQQSKEKIEDILGVEISSLSIPGGRFNNKVISCARKLGYKSIFTSTPFQLTICQGITLVGRIGMRNPMAASEFRKYLNPSAFTISRLKTNQFIKTGLKSLIGGHLYYILWKIIVKKQ